MKSFYLIKCQSILLFLLKSQFIVVHGGDISIANCDDLCGIAPAPRMGGKLKLSMS